MPAMIGHDRQRRVALLGVLAILIQALLFGWHHHALGLPSGGEPSLAAASGTSPQPTAAEDDCQICAALHHLSAVPADFIALLLPVAARTAAGPSPLLIAPGPYRAPRARAPPVTANLA